MIETPQPTEFPVIPTGHDFVPHLVTTSAFGSPTEFRVSQLELSRSIQLQPVVSSSFEHSSMTSESIENGFLRPLLERVGNHHASVSSAAMMLIGLSRFREVVALVSEHRADDFWSIHCLSVALKRLGRSSESRAVLQSFADKAMDDPRPLHALARFAIEDSEWAQAVELLSRAACMNDAVAAMFNDLGVAQLAAGRTDDAIRSFRRAVSSDTNCVLALTNLGVCSQLKRRHVRAMALLRRAIALDPNCAPAIHNLGEALISVGRFEDAIFLLERRSEPQACSRLAWAYFRLGRNMDARRIFEVEARRSPNESVLNNLAIVCAKQNDLTGAVRAFERALSLPTVGLGLRKNYAAAMFAINDYRSICRILPIDLAVTDAEATHILAAAMFQLHLGIDTQGLLERAHQRFPEDAKILTALSAVYAIYLDRCDFAVSLLEHVDAARHDIPLANNLAYALLRLNRVDEAREVLSGIQERVFAGALDSSKICALATFGLLDIMENRYEAGIARYRAAYETATGDLKRRVAQKINVEEGRYLMRQNKVQRATERLKKALEGPDIGFANEARTLLSSKKYIN